MSEPQDGKEDNLDMVDFLSRWNEMKVEEVLVDSFHELRNPIYVMQGYINLLSSKELSLSPEETERFLNNLSTQAAYSKSIIDSIFVYLNQNKSG